MKAANSVNGISVRIPDERMAHIIEEHPELAGLVDEIALAISEPERVLKGNAGEQLGVRGIGDGKFLVVVYKEIEPASDGFVITAFVTRRIRSLDRRVQLWP